MLGCDVPPWRTITFGGGQGLAVPAAVADWGDPESDPGCFGIEPEAGGAGSGGLSQSSGTTFFLCAVFFFVAVCDVWHLDVFPGGVLMAGVLGVSVFGEGFEPL